MRKRVSRRWLFIGGVLAVAIVVAGMATLNAMRLRQDVSRAREAAGALRTSVVQHDETSALINAEEFQRAISDAHKRTHSILWSGLRIVPLIGDDVRAVQHVADAGYVISGQPLTSVLNASTGNVWRSLLPRDGRVSISSIGKLKPLVESALPAFAEANRILDRTKSENLIGSFRGQYQGVADQVKAATRALNAVSTAASLLPSMLGKDGPREYLVAFDTNAEIRSNGGMPGAVAVLRADDGEIRLTSQAPGAELGQVVPQGPIGSQAEQALYGVQPRVYFLDTNMMPDYDRSAELMRAMWSAHAGKAVDGTISLDVVALSYLMPAIGTVNVGGVELTPGNLKDQLLNEVYLRFKNPRSQDAFLQAAAKEIFDRILHDAKPAELLSGLAQGVDEGRVEVHSFHASEQRLLSPLAIGGIVDYTMTKSPKLGIYLQDATGSKMSYYLRRSVTIIPQECTGDRRQVFSARAVFQSTAPTDVSTLSDTITGAGTYGTPPGTQLVFIKVYAPSGGAIGSFRFDGKLAKVDVVLDRGRPVATPVMLLKPGQVQTVTWKVTTGKNQPRGLQWVMTPGLDPEPYVRNEPSACTSN